MNQNGARWHFKAVSNHIEIEEYVHTEARLLRLAKLVKWAQDRYMDRNGLVKDSLMEAFIRCDHSKVERVKDPILTVTITPLNNTL